MKKIISLICCVAVLLCCIPLSTGLLAAATDEDVLNTSLTDSNIASYAATNLLFGKAPNFSYSGFGGTQSNSRFAKITDGMSTGAELYCGPGSRLVYSLDKPTKVTSVGLWNTISGGYAVCYEYYVGTSISSLFNAENLVFSYDASLYPTSKGQMMTFADANAKTGTIIGIKIVKDSVIDQGYIDARINEVYVGGTQTDRTFLDDNADYLGSASVAARNNSTVVNGMIPSAVAGFGGYGASNFATLTDGDNTQECLTYLSQSANTHTITYSLGVLTQVSKIGLLMSSRGYRISYEIYASTEETTLYDASNIVYSWDKNTNDSMGQVYNLAKSDNIKVKFIGIKITSPTETSSDTGVRLYEFYVAGRTLGYTLNSTMTDNDAAALVGNNILKNKKPILLMRNKTGAYGGQTTVTINEPERLTDGNVTTTQRTEIYQYIDDSHREVSGTNIVYQLDGYTEISGFLFNHNTGGAVYEAGYQVYVGTTLDNLYNDANMAFEWIPDVNVSSKTQYVEFDAGHRRSGYFVGIRILYGCNYGGTTSDTLSYMYHGTAYVREIAFFGTTDTTDTVGYKMEAYNSAFPSATTSLLYGKDIMSWVRADKTITTKPGWTDGDINANVEGYYAKNTTITYDLGRNYDINRFAFWQPSNSNRFWCSCGYEVYVGTNPDTLFNGTPVFIWNASTDVCSMQRCQNVALTDDKIGRYVGVKITDSGHSTNDISYFAELAVWGDTAQNVTVADCVGGNIATDITDDAALTEGDTVTVTATPQDGYVLVPGTLCYTTKSGTIKKIINKPESLATGEGEGNIFNFKMPAEQITLTAQFAATTSTNILFDTVATSVYSNDGSFSLNSIKGVRFLSRMYLPDCAAVDENNLEVKYNGADRTVVEFGSLISRGDTVISDIDTVQNDSATGWKSVAYSKSAGSATLVDKTDSYIDFTVVMTTTKVDNSQFLARNYSARSYMILDDGTVIYSTGSITDNAADCMNRLGLGSLDPAKYTSYNLDGYMQNYWEGNAVYNETVIFDTDANGVTENATLMYQPLKVWSVRSIDLATEYVEGVDYTVEGKNIVLTNNSRITKATYDALNPKYADGVAQDWLVTATDSTRYTALTSLRNYQVAVTYTHLDAWTGTTPANQLSTLSRTKSILESGGNLNLVFFGDSITAGYEASGQNELAINMDSATEATFTSNKAPYMPAWATLVSNTLAQRYPSATINKVNRGAPSAYSAWGAAHTDLVTAQDPDLVVIAFGMNESTNITTYKSNITSIVNSIHNANPDAEFLLVSCFIPNTDNKGCAGHKLDTQESQLYEIQSELTGLNIAVAPVNAMERQMLSMGKKIKDGLNNNLNHPNDFMGRLYAQTINAALS